MSTETQYEKAKHELAQRLRQLRRQAGMSGTQVAELLSTSQSRISKLETGTTAATRRDIEELCSLYKAPKKTLRELLDQLNLLETEFNNWRMYLRQNPRQTQTNHRAFETAASQIRLFQPAFVPGLMQTVEYTRAILSHHPDDVISEYVAGRVERQGVLYELDKSFTFIITEGALRWGYGSTTVMWGQMERLLSLMDLPNVRVGVIPLMSITDVSPRSQFCIFDDDFVTVETLTAEMVVRDKDDVATYTKFFAKADEAAVHGDSAKAIVRTVGSGFRSQQTATTSTGRKRTRS